MTLRDPLLDAAPAGDDALRRGGPARRRPLPRVPSAGVAGRRVPLPPGELPLLYSDGMCAAVDVLRRAPEVLR
jgi:hypothetical protein